MSSELIWNNDGTGYIVNYLNGIIVSQYCVYTPQYGIERAIDDYIHYICRHPLSIQQIMKKVSVDGPIYTSTESISFNLSMIHPKQSTQYLSTLIKDIVHKFLYDKINENTDDLSDILFMAKAGSIRDWSKDCPICLEEKIGDPHGWGGPYCQIILFRPCGHSICTKCNRELIKCPLCRRTIIKFINHNHARFDKEIIDQLTNMVLESYKIYK
jgi:hypothetical protein